MIADFFEMLSGVVFSVLNSIFDLLPVMPYGVSDLQAYMSDSIVGTMLSWMNYFLPIVPATAMISLWATGMMAYIGIKLAMKYSNRLRV